MLLKTGKEKCDCGNMAKWVYMPGFSSGESPYICDDCISSPEDIGCSCCWNTALEQEGLPQDLPEGIEGKDWRWVEHEGDEFLDKITKEDGYWLNLDERGRPYPCVEYEFSDEGFDKYTWLGEKMYSISNWWFWFKRRVKFKLKVLYKKHIVDTVPNDYEGF